VAHRSAFYTRFLARMAAVDASVQATPEAIRSLYREGI
jgi:hypothetical protein